jgi:hypothetical protein
MLLSVLDRYECVVIYGEIRDCVYSGMNFVSAM